MADLNEENFKIFVYIDPSLIDFDQHPILDDPHATKAEHLESEADLEKRKIMRKRIYARLHTTTKRQNEIKHQTQSSELPAIDKMGMLFKITTISALNALKKNFTFIRKLTPEEEGKEICFLKELKAVPEEEIPPGIGEIVKLQIDTTRELERLRHRNNDLIREISSIKEKGEAGEGVSGKNVEQLKAKANELLANNNKILIRLITKFNVTPQMSLADMGKVYIEFRNELLKAIKSEWSLKVE